PEDHERIFERFERVEHAELGFPAGTGLGLYLSRRLAEAMGAWLRLERSSPGAGSTFVLDLPLVPEPAVARAAAAPEQRLEAAARPAAAGVTSWLARSGAARR
ncbi:MAG TPA: ATP-binding protein, partial [Candidatus Dormibacteraeota bacterium]|nr:ATP-binding protein [Candidatus Dormibacteraeota bacterium]